MNPAMVYVAEDDPDMCQALAQTLELGGYGVTAFQNAEAVIHDIETGSRPDVLITDLKMPGIDGITLLDRVLSMDPELPVVLISGHADIAAAVRAMQQGAHDFIEKPFPSEQLLEVVNNACKERVISQQQLQLREELSALTTMSPLIGRTPAMVDLKSTLQKVAATNADVLIYGETGTGKELVAESLHAMSARHSHPFVAINCGGMPETLFESEIFGHVKGAFTSADSNQVGKMEYANHGTFFLDEIESMPVALQIKLLRALQQRKIQRLGSNKEIALDLRVVAATKADLLQMTKEGSFREDLYYRLNVVVLRIPPLRERKDDIPLLFQHFFDEAGRRHGNPQALPSAQVIDRLFAHDWPGNVRELRNFAERAALGLPSETTEDETPGSAATNPLLGERMEAYEKFTIERELLKQRGNLSNTYKALGVSRKTLYDKMKKYGITRDKIHRQLDTEGTSAL